VDKHRLTTLINQPEKIEEKDFKELTSLKSEYPYFQALSLLITVGSKKFDPNSEKKYLQSAAIHALDRKHLKTLLTSNLQGNSISQKVKDNKPKESNKPEIQNKENTAQDKKAEEEVSKNKLTKSQVNRPSGNLPDSFFEELFQEMEALKAAKENYQKTLEKFEAKESNSKENPTKARAPQKSSKTKSKNTESPKKASPKSTSKKPTASKTTSSSKKTSTAAKKKVAPSKSKKETSSTRKKKPSKKQPKTEDHDLIQELKSRKEIKISDAHKKEQIDIINDFIEKEPVLSKRISAEDQASRQEAEDLSANSTNLSDDVVSETLAKLMLKQGRKEKAIDIYKKLIWKFPQKKTYFVEIIGELKKQL
jgi:tetratricopeptide (TPR) repeat protein